MQVWAEIAKIPFGETITYSEIAELLDKPDAVRAVGTATGANPLSIIIPCHRVVGKCGTLTGYAGGIPRKAALLDFESGKTDLVYSDPTSAIPRIKVGPHRLSLSKDQTHAGPK